MGKTVGNAKICNIFFVKPDSGCNVLQAAKKLIGVREIKEVIITDGECGFVVKTDPIIDNIDRLGKVITRIVGGSNIMAMGHYQYRK
ncbi:MAG: hypothetical protein ACYCO0_04265 [Candidatus Micrarchaeaceae archaeon]